MGPRGVVGVAAPEPARNRFGFWFSQTVWHGLTDAAVELGIDLLFVGKPLASRMLRDGAGLLELPVDGFVFIAPQVDAPALKLLYERGVPFATIAGDTDLPYPTFGANNERAMYQALTFLRQLGHTKIAHISGPSNMFDGRVRERAFRQFMDERNLSLPEEYIQRGGFVLDGGASAMQTLLSLPQRPTAIVAGNDMSAYGAMDVAARSGVAIPEEISFIGFDDDNHAGLHRPSLTTLRQPAYEAAQEALKAVCRMAAGETGIEGQKLDAELIVRDSTAVVPK